MLFYNIGDLRMYILTRESMDGCGSRVKSKLKIFHFSIFNFENHNCTVTEGLVSTQNSQLGYNLLGFGYKIASHKNNKINAP